MPVTVRVFLSWNVDRPSGAKVIESSEVQRDGSVRGAISNDRPYRDNWSLERDSSSA